MVEEAKKQTGLSEPKGDNPYQLKEYKTFLKKDKLWQSRFKK